MILVSLDNNSTRLRHNKNHFEPLINPNKAELLLKDDEAHVCSAIVTNAGLATIKDERTCPS